MSYYYEDTPHYYYTVPAHYVDTPTYYADAAPSDITSGYYDDSPLYDVATSLYDVDTSSYDVDTPLYDVGTSSYDVVTPSYDVDTSSYDVDASFDADASSFDVDTYPDPIYYDDAPTHEDDQHYVDAPLVEFYHRNDIHPAYHDYPVLDNNHEHSAVTNHSPEDHIEPVHLPADKYGSLNDFSDEKLVQTAQLFEEMLEEMRVWDAEDAESSVYPEGQRYRDSDSFKDLTQSICHIETVQRQRTERSVDVEVEVLENQVFRLVEPIPIPLPHHHTPAFHCTITKRRKPRYYLGPRVRRRHPPNLRSHKFRYNNRTNPPPDIRPPEPFPPSPNISALSQQSKLLLLRNHYPPDILTPKPFPPAPNIPTRPPIFQQPRRPSRLRPRRKHPPDQVHSLIPHHHHNVIRRILKKKRPCLFSMFEDEHHLEGTRCGVGPFSPFPFHLSSLPSSLSPPFFAYPWSIPWSTDPIPFPFPHYCSIFRYHLFFPRPCFVSRCSRTNIS